MRRFVIAIVLICCAAGVAHAALADGPVHTILWNDVRAVTTVDSFLVALGRETIAVCHYDNTLNAFVPVMLQPLPFEPRRLRICDSLLLIQTKDNRISVYHRNRLPELVQAGIISPPVPFADFVLYENDLFLSSWFDGIRRFRLNGFESLEPVDTTMAGMLITQLEIRHDTLYALDEYNGIMRFDLTGPGFGTFIDFLWVPYDAASFTLLDDHVLIPSPTAGIGIGEFGHSRSGIIDSLPGIPGAEKAFLTETEYVLLDHRAVHIVNRFDPNQAITYELVNISLEGDIFCADDRVLVLLPRPTGGLALIDPDDPDSPHPGLFRDGPITSVHLYDGRLFTGGACNPVDIFSVDTIGNPSFSHTLFDELRNVNALNRNGDSLIVTYAKPNKVVFVAAGADPDSFYIEGSIFVSDSTITDVQYYNTRIDTVRPILAVGEELISIYAATDSSGIFQATTWKSIGRICSAMLYDTLLLVGTRKNQLWVLSVGPDLSLAAQPVIGLASSCEKMLMIDSLPVLFVSDNMLTLDLSDPSSPRVMRSQHLPVPVYDAVVRKDRLYTIGPLGAGVFSIDSLGVEVIDFGGHAGTMLDVEGSVLATSDGSSIHLYYLTAEARPTPEPPPLPITFELAQNYPNPFNSATKIEYSLPAASKIRIVVYNILGQQVKTLIDTEQEAGKHTVVWNGTDGSGDEVASGVYFYRLTVGNRVSSKKMMMLK
ncbi:MAG: T9SS type A sorting domain-containing protein [Candidatus Zixiibacteriota bacterium]